jgi:hypothetical protein
MLEHTARKPPYGPGFENEPVHENNGLLDNELP